jgi:hypothetical protein
MVKWPFGRKKKQPEFAGDNDEAAEMDWYNEKTGFMESVLGKEHDHVMHAIIPYSIGGGLDLYYYPNGIKGTGVATKELVDASVKGPSNKVFAAYELVMFTENPLDLDKAKDKGSPFGSIHSSFNSLLNMIARYSSQATLNPNETCEFPQDMEHVGGKCLIFDAYPNPQRIGPKGLGLLLIIEIFRSEMKYAMENGGARLIHLLKQAEHYPYSDLNRDPVV